MVPVQGFQVQEARDLIAQRNEQLNQADGGVGDANISTPGTFSACKTSSNNLF
jgi:hypothetical protein